MSWTLIESQTLGASAASVTLGSGGTIPQTYKTLKLVTSLRINSAGTAGNAVLTVNGSTSSYSERLLYGNGSAANSASASGSSIGWTNLATGNNGSSNTFGNAETTFPNYTSSAYKPISSDSVNENNSSAANDANQYLDAALWSNTAAVTSITLTAPGGSNFMQYSTFTLYGLK